MQGEAEPSRESFWDETEPFTFKAVSSVTGDGGDDDGAVSSNKLTSVDDGFAGSGS